MTEPQHPNASPQEPGASPAAPPRPATTPLSPNFPNVPPRRGGSNTPLWSIGAVLLALAAVGLAYQGLRSDMSTRFAALEKELDSVRAEVRDLREQLNAADDEEDDGEQNDTAVRNANTVRINVNGYPVLGNPKASLVMVEFTDFQCPYCARYHANTFPTLKRAYIDSQRMRYVSVDFPLDFHSLAFKAAEAAHCGDEQGQYWPVFSKLFQTSPRIDMPDLMRIAGDLQLNTANFKRCLEGGTMESKVRRGLGQAAALGIDGTPTFVIGRAEGAVVRGRLVVGAYPTEVFEQLIRSHLALQ